MRSSRFGTIVLGLCLGLLAATPSRAWAQTPGPDDEPDPWTSSGPVVEEAARPAAVADAEGAASTVVAGETKGEVELAAPVPKESTLTQDITRYTTLVALPVTMVVYGQAIWDWGDTYDWHSKREDWFGRDTPYGGIDKLGHVYGHYVLYRASHAIFDYTENGAPRKRLYALILATSIGLGIEVGDGFNGLYGFSVEDLIADLAGIGLGVVMEEVPAVEDLLAFSTEYWPSEGFLNSDESFLEFGEDYGAYKYMLNFKLAGTDHLGLDLPRALDFFTIDVGYIAHGFSRFDVLAGDERKVRSWFVGASLNVPELIDVAFKHGGHGESKLNRGLHEFFGYYHLPLGYKYETVIDDPLVTP